MNKDKHIHFKVKKCQSVQEATLQHQTYKQKQYFLFIYLLLIGFFSALSIVLSCLDLCLLLCILLYISKFIFQCYVCTLYLVLRNRLGCCTIVLRKQYFVPIYYPEDNDIQLYRGMTIIQRSRSNLVLAQEVYLRKI